MYQFKYEVSNPFDFYPPTELCFTCIVPANWLSLNLPTMSGGVNYSDNLGNLVSCGSFVFEFCERSSSDSMWRTFSLDILRDGEKHFDVPIAIHVPSSIQSEVLLLNHLFGFYADSSFVAVDFGDLLELLKKGSTYYLRYGAGKSPADILPNILQSAGDGNVKCEFLMIFDGSQRFRLEYIDEAVDAMSSGGSDESMLLIGAAFVEQDEMLISALVGY